MPQPIDLQSELGRVTAAERVQQVADRVSLVAQQRVAADSQTQQVLAETQVQQAHAKSEEVEPELRRRNPYVGRKRRRAAAGQEAEPAPPAHGKQAPLLEPHKLDITI